MVPRNVVQFGDSCTHLHIDRSLLDGLTVLSAPSISFEKKSYTVGTDACNSDTS